MSLNQELEQGLKDMCNGFAEFKSAAVWVSQGILVDLENAWIEDVHLFSF